MPAYPALPAEEPYGDIELDMIENEPAGLFPDGQDSLWGQYRKTISDYLQLNVADALAQWYENLDPRTTHEDDLPEYEAMFGVPYAPSNLTIAQRRSFVLSRMYRGLLTRTNRNQIIESFITPTFGPALSFDPGGLTLDAGGLSLFSGASGDVKTMYRVYEDVLNFKYEVRVRDDLDVDMIGLRRELRRVTPAGINSAAMTAEIIEAANVLDYAKAVVDLSPIGFWRFGGNFNDSSGHARNLAFGGGTAWTSLGASLINSAVAYGNTSYTTSGSSYYNHATFNQWLVSSGEYTLAGWLNIPTLTVGQSLALFRSSAWVGDGYNLGVNYVSAGNPRNLVGEVGIGGTTYTLNVAAASGIAFVALRRSKNTVELFLNGVQVGQVPAGVLPVGAGLGSAGGLRIGEGNKDFTLDELAAYNYALTDAQLLALYRTGTNVP